MVVGGYRGPFPSVEGIVRVPSLGRSRAVSFIIDTGAVKSVLCEPDIFTKLGLVQNDFHEVEAAVGIGGERRQFEYDDMAELEFEGVSEPIPFRIRRIEGFTYCSLLGQDVLTRFALLANAASGGVWLLTPEEVAEAWSAQTT